MEIHELNTYNGNLDGSAYLAIDNTADTAKIPYTQLMKPVNDRLAADETQISAIQTEVTDARTGADGTVYPSLGDAIRGQVNDAKSDLSGVEEDLYSNDDFAEKTVTFQKISGTAHSANVDKANIKILVGGNFVLSFTSTVSMIGVQIYAYYSDGTQERLGIFSAQDYTNDFTANKDIASIGLFITADQPTADITFSVIINGGMAKAIRDNEKALSQKMDAVNVSLQIAKENLVSGSLQTQTMTVSANNSCVAYLQKIPVNGGETIKVEAPTINGVAYYKYRFGFYDSTGAYLSQIATQTSDTVKVGNAVRFISFHVQGFGTNDSQVTFNVRDAFANSDVIKIVYRDRHVPSDDIATKAWAQTNFEKIGNSGYVINGANIKQGVSSVRLGELKYLQAFCVYENKYYSIDGSNIAEQDVNFNVLRDVPLNTGHGNSLQLGHNGKAYASGWNDSKIYIVDLVTLAIDSEITLPITGYFSAVVDDLNNLAYILHRASYPDTVANYIFTVYDISRDSIISSRVVNSFGALQGCDFAEGKIIACYGLGNANVPNGITIYNSAGDILAKFELNLFSITELEGIAFNRSDDGIYVSLYNKSIYKVW